MDTGALLCLKKSTILLTDVDNTRRYACVWTGSTQEISVPSPQFCCKPKTSPKEKKNKSLRKDERKGRKGGRKKRREGEEGKRQVHSKGIISEVTVAAAV